MSLDHGNPTPQQTMTLNPGEDFQRVFRLSGEHFPDGAELYYRLHTSPMTTWQATIEADLATFAVASTEVDTVPIRTEWQLLYKDPDADETSDDTEVCWGRVTRSHRGGLPT